MTVISLQGVNATTLRRDTGKLSDEYSSSSSASTSSASSAASSDSTVVGPYVTPGGGSTTVYLIALLITIIVLAAISGALVFRAYYMRRRLRRAMQESIRTGQPLPPDAAAAFGIFRPNPYGGARRGGRLGKGEKHVGAMPSMWEGEMYRDVESGWQKDEEEDSLLEKKGKDGSCWSGIGWDDIDPLTLVHITPPSPPPPPEPLTIPQFEAPSYFRALFISTRPRPIPRNTTYHSVRPNHGRGVNGRQGEGAVGIEEIPKVEPNWTIPPPGEEMLLGVMIAMPTQGRGEELWETEGMEEREERDLPNVELGVISAKMGEY
ncbi:hypothetical protein C367_05602 [Cryptococcus neoformans Ze90-1]|nr:hypothetical protein C367_05602 [Cryptococcus neoformans var. grubii Ze90-1]